MLVGKYRINSCFVRFLCNKINVKICQMSLTVTDRYWRQFNNCRRFALSLEICSW
uniref:Uncharacterized protein n=1 Tax=Papilio xuthus TaxID=66420 RepID=I4DLP5_PAPXU|nr:unknown unsecreted protein [Papilio xuthus]